MTDVRELTEQDGRIALRDHVEEKAREARRKYGSAGWPQLQAMLDDRAVVRYPTEIRFDAGPLQAGEFAHAAMLGNHPGDGYCLYVHPSFEGRSEDLPLLVAYHLVCVNYGDIVTAEEAELFGAALLGMDVEAYYQRLCQLADELG